MSVYSRVSDLLYKFHVDRVVGNPLSKEMLAELKEELQKEMELVDEEMKKLQ